MERRLCGRKDLLDFFRGAIRKLLVNFRDFDFGIFLE